MYISCIEKQKQIIAIFSSCSTVEDKYQKIIDLGKTQKPIDPEYKTSDTLVSGCQSTMYLYSYFENGCVFFQTESDAIISAGLGILLTSVYSGESPETILKCPPQYIEDLGIRASLTPGRANGLGSIYLKMKQLALKYYMESAGT